LFRARDAFAIEAGQYDQPVRADFFSRLDGAGDFLQKCFPLGRVRQAATGRAHAPVGFDAGALQAVLFLGF
jgi:hypothetical protein